MNSASSTGRVCAPASASGPVYGGGFSGELDQGPHVGSEAFFMGHAALVGCVTTLTIVVPSCWHTPAGSAVLPSLATDQPSAASSASSVTKQPTGPQMPVPCVCRATLTPVAGSGGIVQVVMSTVATVGAVQQAAALKQAPPLCCTPPGEYAGKVDESTLLLTQRPPMQVSSGLVQVPTASPVESVEACP